MKMVEPGGLAKEAPTLVQEHIKTKEPPLDFFGITPDFYIDGEPKVQSWVGFFCSVTQALVILVIIIVYSINFMNKKESKITILNVIDDSRPLLDLQKNRQILVLNYFFSAEIEPEKIFDVKAFYVREEKRTKLQERTSLQIVSCESVKTDVSDIE